MRLSVLDLAPLDEFGTAEDAYAALVTHAKAADRAGYTRIWYAEHHNMPIIASSATSVLIAHVAQQTKRIRVGSGGIMLPNHSPLVIAEQFGTLAALHPGRIDLGLGRAPGTDHRTVKALRRDLRASDRFPQDVVELSELVAGREAPAGIRAYPTAGTPPELFILGSSLFGATLAAQLGLPYAFASHFAPDALLEALAAYRSQFTPSEALQEPYAIVAANVVAHEDAEEAARMHQAVLRQRARIFLRRPSAPSLTDDEADALLETAQGQSIQRMMRIAAVGDAPAVRAQLESLVEQTGADELMLPFQGRNSAERTGGLEITGTLIS